MKTFPAHIEAQLSTIIGIISKLTPDQWASVKERVDKNINDKPKTYNSTEKIYSKNQPDGSEKL